MIINYFFTFAAIMVKNPHPLIAIIPVVVLIGLLAIAISLFGSDSLSGGSQIALLMGMAVCVSLSMTIYKTPWRTFEKQIKMTLGEVSITLLILLCVGMLAGSWMVSGIVPTLIYYGGADYVATVLPRVFVHYLCPRITALWQFVDDHRHHWCRPIGHRPCVGCLRGLDGRRHHLRCLFRR